MEKLALIGVGYWGKNLLREFSRLGNVPIYSSLGSNHNKKWVEKKYPKIKFENTYKKILENKEINGIVIATPIKSHYELILKALNSNKHVFVEKTLGENLFQSQKLAKIAKEKNLILFTGYIFLYHPIFVKIKKLIKNEKIKYLEFNWEKTGKFTENILDDLVSHCISMCIELIGIPKEISILNQQKIISKCDIISINLLFSKNLRCIININRCSPIKKRNFKIITENNIFSWENDELYKFNFNKKQFKKIFESKKSPLIIECKEFMKSLHLKKNNYINTKNAVQVMQVLDKIK